MTIAASTVVALVLGFLIGVLCVVWWPRDGRPRTQPVETPSENKTEWNEPAFVRLVRAMPIGVMLLDRRARVTFANAAAGSIFGFDIKRSLGAHIIQSIPNVELERRIDEALRGEASVAQLILTATTGQRTYRVSVYPLAEDEDGVVIFADDQTNVARLDRARKEFLSNVSHELRTPLASIKLMLETVIASPDDEAGDLFLPQALTQVDRLASLVLQLLDQARAESGQLQLNLQEVDLTEVARPIIASFEPQAMNKGVAIDLRAGRQVKIEADPDRLAQIFVNLIDNAIRHTPSGGSVIVEIDAKGAEAVLRVRDTGDGIPYRDLPHIFERFYVVERSRNRMTGGAGLGLAIVRGIVDAHGGTIAAESMLGSGTTFTVRLPIMRVNVGIKPS